MTRQYIGARYVPKFYDYNGSPDWRSGVEYEPLTIVTRNGNSYTSKKPVPSSIGAPENNPEYWVSTGVYNQQVEAYRQLAEQTANTLDAFMSDGAIGTDNLADGSVTTPKIANEAVTTPKLDDSSVTTSKIADSNVTTQKLADSGVTASKIADGAVTTEKIPDDSITIDKLAPKYIINVGDSYQGGYDPEGNNDGWGAYLLSMFGYQGHNIQGVGGAGFGAGAGSQYDLATILYNNPPSNIAYDKVTDIVVGSGYNDFNRDTNSVADGITRFYEHCKSRYPNAKIWLAPIGWAWTNNGDGITPAKVGATFTKYALTCKNMDINFINSCLGILFGCNGLTTDYKHPTQSGNKAIASAINAAFNGLPYLSVGGSYNLPVTSSGWSGSIQAAVSTINGIATIRLAFNGLQYSGSSISLTDVTLDFAHMPFMCRFSAIIGSMIQYDNSYVNAPMSFAVKSDGTCSLGLQIINSSRNNYESASSIRPSGASSFQPAFAVDVANG